MENVKETANDMAAMVEQLKITNQYLSGIHYLLMFGEKINKNEHYSEMVGRLKGITSIQELHQ